MMAERLEWEHEAAPILEQLRLRKRETKPFEKEVLDRRPPHDEAVDLGMRALFDLSTCRPVGMGIGPIPITAMWLWCSHEGLDADATAILARALRHADGVYLGLKGKS